DPFGEVRTLTLLDIETQRTQPFSVPDNAIISDRLNQPRTFSELRIGNMVDIEYDTRTFEIISLNQSRRSWERRSRTNVQINIGNFEISSGNETWTFNSQTLVLYKGEPFSISQIRPIDSVTMIGMDDTVWLVQLDAAHGFLQFTNADMIVNGSVMVGNSLILALDDITADIELAEGTHRIMVEGDNIETYIENIEIIQGQTMRVNLGDAQLRAALLQIVVTPDDAQVFVNGELHDNSELALVEFGENIVRVERHGYHTQEERFVVEDPIGSVVFHMTEIVTDITLSIFTSPFYADIYINNAYVGLSPVTQTVTPGTYTVRARMTGYGERTIVIEVTGNETEEIMRSLILEPSNPDPFANMPPPDDVDPLQQTPTPMPTQTPVPLPTLPPEGSPPSDEPPPGDANVDIPWWQLLPP
ncbi:MAG: PEGA domain-containing protein, partial [Clostridiales bacterium]|nr:PEGA domain-containing protein [Clostridiales bacterium]